MIVDDKIKELGKKQIKAEVQKYLNHAIKNETAAAFMTEMFASSYDLVELSIKEKGDISKAEIAQHFGEKFTSGGKALAGGATVGFSGAAKYKCAMAMIDFTIDASKIATEKTGWGKFYAAGYLASVSSVNIWGECYLPYQEQKMIDAAIEKVKSRYAQMKARACADAAWPKSDEEEVNTLKFLLNKRMAAPAPQRMSMDPMSDSVSNILH